VSAASEEAPVRIRGSVPADSRSIEALYPLAFPDEDLLQLVRILLLKPAITISLVAVEDSRISGNIIFTRCALNGGRDRAALLAPLAVAPDRQKQGIGSALVHAGLERLKGLGIQAVYVLGDPAYYGRFGFSPERSVKTPYPIPAKWADAWQSQRFGVAAEPLSGTLHLPDFWLDPALWAP
jgi:putative acetyltransferase